MKKNCVKKREVLVKLKLESNLEDGILFAGNGLYKTVSEWFGSGVIFILYCRI